jgi:hypothetical protein
MSSAGSITPNATRIGSAARQRIATATTIETRSPMALRRCSTLIRRDVPKHIIEGLVLEDVLPLGRPECFQKGWYAQRWFGWVTEDDYEEIIDRRFLGIRY